MKPGQIAAIIIGLAAAGGLAFSQLADSSEPSITPIETQAATPDQTAQPTDQTSAEGEPEAEQFAEAAVAAPENLGPAGTLTDLDGWLQTEATSFSDFDGGVRIVQFWTFSCYNCKNTIPHLSDIYETYKGDGLEIIGVHAPEFDFESDPDAIAAAAQEEGVTWPIAIDNNKTNFRSWQSGKRYWPRTFVLDANGDIRFDHIGEGAYDELEATVAYLLANGGV